MTNKSTSQHAKLWQASPAQVSGAINPPTAITIAVDTAYVASKGSGTISGGVYMFDNRLSNGSSGEGSLELFTKCNIGDYIGFEAVPVNANTGDTVVITGFQVSDGSIFGNDGYPMQIGQAGNYWVGQAENASQQTVYQIQLKITTGGLRPRVVFVQWDPFLGTN